MEEFEKQLIELIQTNPIPLEAKLYVMKHVYSIAEAEYKRLLTESEKVNDDRGSDKAD